MFIFRAAIDNHETRLSTVEQKIEKLLENNAAADNMRKEIELLKRQLSQEKSKVATLTERLDSVLGPHNNIIVQVQDQIRKIQESQNKFTFQAAILEVRINSTYDEIDQYHETTENLTSYLSQIEDMKKFQEHLHITLANHSQSTEAALQDIGSDIKQMFVKLTGHIGAVRDQIMKTTESKMDRLGDNFSKLYYNVSDMTNKFITWERLGSVNDRKFLKIERQLTELGQEKASLALVFGIGNTTMDILQKQNKTLKNLIEQSEKVTVVHQKLQERVNFTSKECLQLGIELAHIKNSTDNVTKTNEITSELQNLIEKVDIMEIVEDELSEKLGNLQEHMIILRTENRDVIDKLDQLQEKVDIVKRLQEELGDQFLKLQNRLRKPQKPQMDEEITIASERTTVTEESYYIPILGNRGRPRASCVFVRIYNDVVVSLDGRTITTDTLQVADGKVITFRCKDVGTFRMHGDSMRQCDDGTWLGTHPVCGPLLTLAEIEAHIVAKNATPSIYIEPNPDSDTTGVLPNGTIVVVPGSKITLSCLFPASKNRIEWSAPSSRAGQLQVLAGRWDQTRIRYQIHMTLARESQSRPYTCINKIGGNHTVHLLVKEVKCPNPPKHSGIIIVGRNDTTMNSILQIQCKSLGQLLVWPLNSSHVQDKIRCLPSGLWSSEWPYCERKTGQSSKSKHSDKKM